LVEGIVVHAPDSSIISNPKASELLGLSEDQIRKQIMDPDKFFE
jgi:hypothetical protein